MLSIACIVPIFNYSNDGRVEWNHRNAMESLRENGVRVYECRAEEGDGPPRRISHGFCLRGTDILWQKEALINYAAKQLKGTCDVLAWVDSGIRLSAGWAKRLRLEMDLGCNVVQLYHKGVWLDRNQQESSRRWGFVWWHQNGRPNLAPGPKASVGGAWAARSEVFDQIRLYDRQVVGGGDTWAVNGFLHVNTPEALVTQDMSMEHRRHVQQWIVAARALRLRVGWIPGEYQHLWHTPQRKRYHGLRHHILAQEGFNPERHTELRNGLVCWSGTAPALLKERVRDFLLARAAGCPLKEAL